MIITSNVLIARWLEKVLNLRARDIGLRAGDRRADRRQQARLIDAGHFDLDRPRRLLGFLPARRRFFDADRSPTRSGNRRYGSSRPRPRVMKPTMCSPGNGWQHSAKRTKTSSDPLDADPQAALLLGHQAKQRLQRAAGLLRSGFEFFRRQQLGEHMARGDPAVTDGRRATPLRLSCRIPWSASRSCHRFAAPHSRAGSDASRLRGSPFRAARYVRAAASSASCGSSIWHAASSPT